VPAATTDEQPKKKQYLPNIINPFEKSDKNKIEKAKSSTPSITTTAQLPAKKDDKQKEK
jgi:hypothetical protein